MKNSLIRNPAVATAYIAAFALIGVSIAFNVGAALERADTLPGQIAWAVASAASDGLKVLCPLALVATLSRRAWGEAAAVTLVLVVTATYSLTSAITFAHGSRDAVTASRIDAAQTASLTRQAFDTATAQLAALGTARLAGEVTAERDAILSDPRAGGCATLDGPFTKLHCPQVATLTGELARAQERQRLETDVAQLRSELAALPAVSAPDPAASAVAGYLALFGFKAPPEAVAFWLSALAVALVEVGSAFGLVVAGALAHVPPSAVAIGLPSLATKQAEPADVPSAALPVAVEAPVVVAKPSDPALVRLKAAANSGVIDASQSELARVLGTSKTAAHRTLHRLAELGAISMTSGTRGTHILVN